MTARFRSKNTAELTLVPAVATGDLTLRRTAALQRSLGAAIRREGDLAVMRAFVDAMELHEGVHVWAYAENTRGAFDLQVAPAMAPAHHVVPGTLWLDQTTQEPSVTRLAPQECFALGLGDRDDVLVARVGDRTVQSWLVLFSGTLQVADEARLSICADMLDQALKTSTRQSATRLRWAILEHLLTNRGGQTTAAAAALRALATAVNGAGAALVVRTTGDGVHVFSAGSAEVFDQPARPNETDDLIATDRVSDAYSITIAVRRRQGAAFTGRERHLIETAVTLFATWLSGVLSSGAAERTPRPAFSGR